MKSEGNTLLLNPLKESPTNLGILGDYDAVGIGRSKSQGEEILDDMLACSVGCGGNFQVKKFNKEWQALNWLYHNLPSLSYIIDKIINNTFSNGLTCWDDTLSEEQNKVNEEILQSFLYAKNKEGMTNYAVLKNSERFSMVFGKYGVRYLSLEDGLVGVDGRFYATMEEESTEYRGFDELVGYALSTNKTPMDKIDLDQEKLKFDRALFERQGILYDDNQKLLLLTDELFANIRFDTTRQEGQSKLAFDKQRVRLLANFYERMNYDIVNDGPGRLLFWLDGDVPQGSDEQPKSTGEVVSDLSKDKRARNAQAMKDATDFANLIKNSDSDNVFLMPARFNKEYKHLERQTKATELLTWAQANEGTIMAEVFGISPILAGVGKISGNISTEKHIDNSMLNDIVPIRENLAIQINALLADKLGVPKIYFDKYEMLQVQDNTDQINRLSQAVERIAKLPETEGSDEIKTVMTDILSKISDLI